MKEIGLYHIKSTLSAVIAALESDGQPVAITRHGKIVAELHPHKAVPSPKRGFLKSDSFFIAPDFDASETGFEDFFDEASPAGTHVAEDVKPYRFEKHP